MSLVRATGLAVRYGRTQVLSGVDVTLRRGDEVALVGRSGSGKSTLLLALAGLLPADGHLAWPGLPDDPRERRAAIAMVFQAPSLLPELTATENVALPLRLRGRDRAYAAAAAREALAAVELAEAADALPAELSGGQQQRVAAARAIAGEPTVLLADEPTGALDAATAHRLVAVLREQVRARDGALLLATHDEDLAATLPARLTLSDGAVRGGPTGLPAPADPHAPDPAAARSAAGRIA